MEKLTKEEKLLKDIYLFVGEMVRSDFSSDDVYNEVEDRIYNQLHEYFLKLYKSKG